MSHEWPFTIGCQGRYDLPLAPLQTLTRTLRRAAAAAAFSKHHYTSSKFRPAEKSLRLAKRQSMRALVCSRKPEDLPRCNSCHSGWKANSRTSLSSPPKDSSTLSRNSLKRPSCRVAQKTTTMNSTRLQLCILRRRNFRRKTQTHLHAIRIERRSISPGPGLSEGFLT